MNALLVTFTSMACHQVRMSVKPSGNVSKLSISVFQGQGSQVQGRPLGIGRSSWLDLRLSGTECMIKSSCSHLQSYSLTIIGLR